MSKAKLEWSEKGEAEDYQAAVSFLSLLCSVSKANALVKKLRSSSLVRHPAKDLLRAANLPLLPDDDAHVDNDLKRIQKAKPLAPVLLIRGDLASGLPLAVADGYHRICAAYYFDEAAMIACQIVGMAE